VLEGLARVRAVPRSAGAEDADPRPLQAASSRAAPISTALRIFVRIVIFALLLALSGPQVALHRRFIV
jgi:hypothetical protein